jgi:hypothetical protein
MPALRSPAKSGKSPTKLLINVDLPAPFIPSKPIRDGHASPMLQLARIADKQISEATLRSFLGSFGFSGEAMLSA